ncbi:MAG: DEAD/DEAH box helicase [Proteobacteria bacterium]|nr:DEAD/DEAH box helicase [Pseudomonadota bacterium]
MSQANQHNVAEYLDALKGSERFGPQVVHHEFLAGQEAEYRELVQPLSAELVVIMAQEGAARLYSHQARAMDFIRQGEDVLVATPTASGKSLIYNMPVIEKIMKEPATRALYLFPLKALAQDQLRRLAEIAAQLPEGRSFTAAVCDGDTSSYRRKKLRENPANIIISNPEMLHLSFLGYHEKWAEFFSNLRYVVIDEVHSYRGVFGSHMAWVLRRLLRICALYGSNPQFLLFSATVGNPGELGQGLIGRSPRVITDSGAPQAPRHFVFFNPWDGAALAASQMLEAALKRGLRTIVYTQSRKITELVAMWTAERLGDLKNKLTAYRAGFLPEERREIEHKLASGELYGVVTTSALELGIDIGSLDICIMVGYPGSIMSTWQRGGRVGRRQQESLIIMVGQEDALDHYFLKNPQEFFRRKVEAAVLNPDNEEISARHLICAAAELPLHRDEPLLAMPAVKKAVDALCAGGQLLQAKTGKRFFTARKYPHRQVDLRGSGQPFVIRKIGGNERLGDIDSGRCFKECHPGALYLHHGETWEVVELDLDGGQVLVRRKEANYFTRAMATKETEILEVFSEVEVRNIKACFGRLKVTDQVTGFQRKLIRGQKTMSSESLDLPPQVFETHGLWFEIPEGLEACMQADRAHFMGGIHAVEHAAIGVFPLTVLCDRNDIGGISYPFHPQLQCSAIFIYDGYPGGIGLCREAFSRIDELLLAAHTAIVSCPCETGCPSCVHSPKCGSGNRPIDKEAARIVLEALLAGDVVRKAIHQDQEEVLPLATAPEGEIVTTVLPRKWAVFDVETQRSAAEVGGWHHAERMGVSVAVVYDGELDDFLVFREGEMVELLDYLCSRELVVGFNNKRFDNQVLSAYGDAKLHLLPTIDLLEEVKSRLGYRLSLDRLAAKTLEVAKSADGLQALKWYKEGRIDKIITYCRHDVEITRDLFLFALENRYLLFQNKAGQTVRCPLALTIPQCNKEGQGDEHILTI